MRDHACLLEWALQRRTPVHARIFPHQLQSVGVMAWAWCGWYAIGCRSWDRHLSHLLDRGSGCHVGRQLRERRDDVVGFHDPPQPVSAGSARAERTTPAQRTEIAPPGGERDSAFVGSMLVREDEDRQEQSQSALAFGTGPCSTSESPAPARGFVNTAITRTDPVAER